MGSFLIGMYSLVLGLYLRLQYAFSLSYIDVHTQDSPKNFPRQLLIFIHRLHSKAHIMHSFVLSPSICSFKSFSHSFSSLLISYRRQGLFVQAKQTSSFTALDIFYYYQ